MPVGRDIVDALECVLSVYFSNVRHRTRAAFLLCDELVEMICKAKFKVHHRNMGRIDFFNLLSDRFVNLDPNVAGSLGETLYKNHDTRNHMQHAAAASTVDDQHCADAILDAILALDHCFPGSSAGLSDPMKTALRVIRLQSSHGNPRQRDAFENAMRSYRWNTPMERATGMTVPIPVGARAHWGHILMSYGPIIAAILDQVGAP